MADTAGRGLDVLHNGPGAPAPYSSYIAPVPQPSALDSEFAEHEKPRCWRELGFSAPLSLAGSGDGYYSRIVKYSALDRSRDEQKGAAKRIEPLLALGVFFYCWQPAARPWRLRRKPGSTIKFKECGTSHG
ncbi:hypothetical protein FIBSPDRAFT_883082 [Athelia psychrophila]|uniref:Uncharacterized protein n=1 Tax=Athelia psychrophila TaxID=1759441 RepID=A0A166UJC4_9AGAM|nr:hypothetical protein FIBSPDRAFT_883082 [Fibularhizoctonia sp. CBS 109695]